MVFKCSCYNWCKKESVKIDKIKTHKIYVVHRQSQFITDLSQKLAQPNDRKYTDEIWVNVQKHAGTIQK